MEEVNVRRAVKHRTDRSISQQVSSVKYIGQEKPPYYEGGVERSLLQFTPEVKHVVKRLTFCQNQISRIDNHDLFLQGKSHSKIEIRPCALGIKKDVHFLGISNCGSVVEADSVASSQRVLLISIAGRVVNCLTGILKTLNVSSHLRLFVPQKHSAPDRSETHHTYTFPTTPP